MCEYLRSGLGSTVQPRSRSSQHFKPTHHPHHEVGEDGDPQSGQNEGQHEALLPASFGTVWDGEEEQEEQRPREQPFYFVANVPCSSEMTMGGGGGTLVREKLAYLASLV